VRSITTAEGSQRLYAIHPIRFGRSPKKDFVVKDTRSIDLGEVILRAR
jgi:hypothetical protein